MTHRTPSYEVMSKEMELHMPSWANVNEQHKFAIYWLYEVHDAEADRRAAFEADNNSRLWALESALGNLVATQETPLPADVNAAFDKLREQAMAGGNGAAYAHIGHRDSLERYGTGHPSERCCKTCGRPTFDKLDAYRSAAGHPYCDVTCYERGGNASAGPPELPVNAAAGFDALRERVKHGGGNAVYVLTSDEIFGRAERNVSDGYEPTEETDEP